jgi:UDP-glucuronate 4-epimerase
MAKILLTGAAGFIGSHVLRHLSLMHQVIAIDNLSGFSNHEIKLKRIAHLTGVKPGADKHARIESDKFSFIVMDIMDETALNKLFAEEHFDMVIHLAAMTGIRPSVENPDIYEKVNIRGFYNIIENCRKYGVKRLLFASSSSVYGACQDVPFTEQSNTDTPLNFYATTKKMNELMACTYASLYNIQCTGLRFFTVYGPWMRPDMATFSFMDNILRGTAVKLHNSGNMERDFTYIDDVVESIKRITIKMTEDAEIQEGTYRIFNVGEGKPVNLKEYVRIIESLLEKKAVIENYPFQKGEMLSTFADCTSLFAYTGFKPRISVIQGLAETVAWFKTYAQSL